MGSSKARTTNKGEKSSSWLVWVRNRQQQATADGHSPGRSAKACSHMQTRALSIHDWEERQNGEVRLGHEQGPAESTLATRALITRVTSASGRAAHSLGVNGRTNGRAKVSLAALKRGSADAAPTFARTRARSFVTRLTARCAPDERRWSCWAITSSRPSASHAGSWITTARR